MTAGQLYFILFLIITAFGTGMITEHKFHLADQVGEQNDQIIVTQKGQTATEAMVGTSDAKKSQITSIDSLQEKTTDAKACPVPDDIFNQLRRAAKTSNSAAR